MLKNVSKFRVEHTLVTHSARIAVGYRTEKERFKAQETPALFGHGFVHQKMSAHTTETNSGLLVAEALIGLTSLSTGVAAPIGMVQAWYSTPVVPQPVQQPAVTPYPAVQMLPLPVAAPCPPTPAPKRCRKKRKGIKWTEPIGLTPHTKYGSQALMRNTGGIVTALGSPAPVSQSEVVPQIAPVPAPTPLAVEEVPPSSTVPDSALLHWVPPPASGRQLCGDGRRREQVRTIGESPSSTESGESIAPTAKRAKPVYWTKRTKHHRVASVWAGSEGVTTPPPLASASSSASDVSSSPSASGDEAEPARSALSPAPATQQKRQRALAVDERTVCLDADAAALLSLGGAHVGCMDLI